MKNFSKKLVVLLMLLVLVTLAGLGQGNVAHASNSTANRAASVRLSYHKTCGWVSCSVYYSRGSTAWLAGNLNTIQDELYSEAVDASMTGEWEVSSTLVALAGMIPYVHDKAVEATSKQQCLRVRYGYPALIALYSDGTSHCFG